MNSKFEKYKYLFAERVYRCLCLCLAIEECFNIISLSCHDKLIKLIIIILFMT